MEAGKRHVDARNVIWLGTSNVGHELVFEHHENRAEPDKRMSREDYLELTAMLRPHVSHCLGVRLFSVVEKPASPPSTAFVGFSRHYSPSLCALHFG